MDGDVSNNGRDGRDGRRVCTLTDGLNDDVDDGRGTDEDDDDDDGRGTNDDDDDDEYEGEVLDGPFSFNLFLYSNKLTYKMQQVKTIIPRSLAH